ncbi:interleukin-1 receptor-associated kinase 1 isoform X3 [Dunckerocampus dactyliophorus]|uniref:interleukin-1 receptor-associated kinase 1 isoform X3 n=1 Tax=Dunckerocampus dactyliophorus TaxID=161453 RepID=UPI002404A8C2|nr:interleukin-1 receptor-associated kinase 1 isoform X3 [Dunckerocampus dactyliophorus]
MSRGDARLQFLYELPASVLCEFCRVMDGLSDLDWTRFASEVLVDQVNVRLSERQERRTNYVMSQWGNRNGRVGELLDLLEHLQLLRPRDIILRWSSSLTPPPPPPVPAAPLRPSPPDTLSRFDPPPKTVVAMTSAKDKGGEGGGSLPRPAPPPSSLQSSQPGPPQGPTLVACGDGGRGVMCWSYEEVYAGTEGFSPALQVGEGGFGVVYRASLRNTDCAVKRLKQDCLQDFAMLKESFNTEVEKLSKFRHPNIVDLLGFCEGPGGVCLIYSYMENRSLEDRLHSVSGALRWSLRVSIVVEVSTALQFLHYPPEGQNSVIHGDVKSSNILLDRHLVAKLADFGLARFVYPSSSRRSASKTTSLGHTTTVRGTLAYLPEEYVRNGQLGTTVDVYSFGVVLLEVLTGRRALEKDKKSGDIYLKDLVKEVQEGPAGSCAVAWRQQLDRRLIIAGGATEPAGSMQMAALACECLDRKCKKRPVMTEVFDKLQDIHKLVRKSDIALLPAPTLSSDCNVEVLSQQVSGLGPLEDTYKPPSYLPPPLSMFSSSSLCASLSSLPPPSTSLHPPSSSSFEGPCETDESRGFSQYDVSTGSHGRSKTLSPPTRNQYHSQTRSNESWSREPSKDQYNVHVHPSNAANRTGPCLSPSGPQMGMVSRQGPRGQTIEKCFSPAGPLQSVCPQSSDAVRHCEASRGPEESDELDYLADS